MDMSNVSQIKLCMVPLQEYEKIFQENQSLKTQINILTGERNQLKTLLDERDKTIDELKKENAELKQRITLLEEENIKLTKRIVVLEDDNINLKKENIELKKDNVILKEEIVELKKENVILKKDNVILKKDIVELKKENVILKEEIVELKKDNKTQKQKNLLKMFLIIFQDINHHHQLEKRSYEPYKTYMKNIHKSRIEMAHYLDDDDSDEIKDYKCIYVLNKLTKLLLVKDSLNKRAKCDVFTDKMIEYLQGLQVTYIPTEEEMEDIENWWEDQM